MSPWAILGGAVIGVGAVAAAPFTGGGSLLGGASLVASLAGAGTAAAAAGAGLAGAGVGAYMSEQEEEEAKKREEELAVFKLKAEKFEEALNKLLKNLNDQQQYFNLVIAMTAVGMACANSDGEIADSEMEYISEFVAGVSKSALPQEVKKKINELYKNPPRLKQAFDSVLAVGADNFDVFDQIIDITIQADKNEHEKELEFKNDWEQLKRIS